MKEPSISFSLPQPFDDAGLGGSELAKQIVLDDLTLNLLVPEQYRDMEQEILAAWREYFYFEKVEAENDSNRANNFWLRCAISKYFASLSSSPLL